MTTGVKRSMMATMTVMREMIGVVAAVVAEAEVVDR
jgi:hypothetical protein